MTNHQEQDVIEAAGINESFHVSDATSANWVVRKIVEARQYAERVQRWAEAELRRAKREEDFFLFRFGAQLEQWTKSQLTSGPRRRKSVALPAGTVGLRATPPHLAVADEERLLAWCKSHLAGAVVVSERVSKRDLMEYIQRTGDCPEGADLVTGGEKFHIR